jgi:hypothetical protein
MNYLARGTLNTLMNLTEADLTQDNRVGNTQKTSNTRLSADTPKGLLAGSVVSVGASGTVVASGAADADIVGIVVNNAVGYPYESSSGVGSGKCVYLHGASSVFTTDLYETRNYDNSADLVYSAGDALHASQNGLLTNETGGTAGSNLTVGIVLIAPSTTDPFMAVQMRI